MKAPPSHVFVDHDDHRQANWDPTKKEQNVSDLLKWISDVQIKRRKFRRTTRCSNLLAEAVLSSALRKAKKDLAVKQEEKRRKAQEFSYQLTIQYSKSQEKTQYCKQETNSISNSKSYYNPSPLSNCNRNESVSSDEEVQACLSSLDNFFSELKSIKVPSGRKMRRVDCCWSMAGQVSHLHKVYLRRQIMRSKIESTAKREMSFDDSIVR
ncbi:hypothetical protein Ocin01_14697 [Orchesella cincta]|uniref:Uncharacterized protein n=1 Tax=Orchesella cincta TaxID=48709 RepID=A0A1D2MG89_ORCCI|nr:hypothetical protein Ocin01_14697 [Orchesella cincta]